MTEETRSSENQPVACALRGDDYRRRIGRIQELARDALQSYERDDLVLHLGYAYEAADRVREMVSGERECCAFLRFELREEHDQIRLTITAPEEARGAAERLFREFGDMAKGCL